MISKNFRALLVAGAMAVSALAGVAIAQQISPIPKVANIGTSDLFPEVVGGQPSVPQYYASAAQIAGAPSYQQSTPLTGFSLAFVAGQKNWTITPAGTLATGAFTTEPNPSDGQEECLFSTQTQTAVTLSPNTTVFTQTITNAITAMAANTRYCYQFSKAASTWYRVQ